MSHEAAVIYYGAHFTVCWTCSSVVCSRLRLSVVRSVNAALQSGFVSQHSERETEGTFADRNRLPACWRVVCGSSD